MTASEIARRRLHNQAIGGDRFQQPGEVVAWLGAVQAQDYAGAKWAIGQRTRDCVDADVEEAHRLGAILRTHVLRPTWHFVTPADLRWMQQLTAPRVRAALAYYDRKLELDEAVLTRARTVLTRALRDGHTGPGQSWRRTSRWPASRPAVPASRASSCTPSWLR